jgi:hemoglobin-like flavoprotein
MSPTPTAVPATPDDPNAALRRSFAAAMRDPDRFGRDFYDRVFTLAPSVRPLFPAELDHQRDKLLRALAMLVRGLDMPETLVPALQQLGARHVGYGVQAPHYAVVGEALIDTLDALSDPPMDPAARAAWTRLYGWIAATMLAGAEAHGSRAPASSGLAAATSGP